MKKYSNDELNELLEEKKSLWKNIDFKYIGAEFKFKGFKESITFVNSVADICEEMNHHPNIKIIFNRVELDVFTHSENAITELDINLANKIENLYKSSII